MPVNSANLPSSFRDPSGFVFRRDETLYRQVNHRYKADYDRLMESGLYGALTSKRRLVAHEEASLDLKMSDDAYKVIRPEPVWFVSYPYEWCFGQLKAAALLTLELQKTALEHGMTLKDASAYNVQFLGYRPVFLDTLSFEAYVEGRPWVAYRQFCQHFLAPLALMSRVDVRLASLLKTHLDGIPLDLASALLPRRTRASFSLLTHIHLHARSQKRYSDAPEKGRSLRVSRRALDGVVASLESAVKALEWAPEGTVWGDYYEHTNYRPESFERKAEIVSAFLERAGGRTAWDLGANTGHFSRLASGRGLRTVAFDIDPAAVEKNYRQSVAGREESLVALQLDLTNPSPAIGWENLERSSLADRGPVDVALALALVHHLVIGNNVPLAKVAAFLARLAEWLIIEFVPKEDSQVRRLLASREDIFDEYREDVFRERFGEYFSIVDSAPAEGTHRTLYLMRRRAGGEG